MIVRVTGIVWGDKGPFALALYQHPTFVCFQAMVVGTEAVEQFKPGEMCERPIFTMITL